MKMLNDTVACFKEIEEDFSTEVAIGVVQIRTIILFSRPSTSELAGKHSFENRMKLLSKRFLSDMSEKDFALCWEIVEVIPSWQVGREIFGIGGVMEMKIKDLLKPLKKKIPKDMEKI
jgi:hypothetical protein